MSDLSQHKACGVFGTLWFDTASGTVATELWLRSRAWGLGRSDLAEACRSVKSRPRQRHSYERQRSETDGGSVPCQYPCE